MSETPLVAGVELGGTKVICTLASGPDDVRERVRLATTTPEQTFAAIRNVLCGWERSGPLAAIGYASFGPVDLNPSSATHGHILNTPKPGWSGADLLATGRDLGLPLGLDTDVNAAAIAEGRWGGAQGLSSFVYVTLGTGVGVGSIVNGRSVRGLGHSEAGHQRVPRQAGATFVGACPFHADCVEGLVSGPAILAAVGRPAEELPPHHPVWDEVVHALAMLFHNLALTVAPERILVGGGLGLGQASHLLPRVRRALLDSLNDYGAARAIAGEGEAWLRTAALGSEAGPLGSVALALGALQA